MPGMHFCFYSCCLQSFEMLKVKEKNLRTGVGGMLSTLSASCTMQRISVRLKVDIIELGWSHKAPFLLLRTARQGKPDPCNPVGPNKGRIVGEHGPLPGWVMICYDCFLWPTKYVSFRWRLVLQMIFWMQGLKNIIPNFFQSLGAIPLSSAMSERHSETVYFYCVIRVCPYFSRKSHSIPEPANIDTIVSDAAWIVSESEKCVSPIEDLGLNPVIQIPHSTQASGIYFRCRQLT